MSVGLLALGVGSLALTANALRPVRWPTALGLVSFFAGWLTADLPVVQVVIQGLIAAWLVGSGALGSLGGEGPLAWEGVVGLVLLVSSWAGLVRAHQGAHLADQAMIEALRALGVDDAAPSGWRPRQLLAPFWLVHPDVRVTRRIRLGDHGRWRRLRADVYHPRDRREGCPVLVFVHGGGWLIRFREFQGLPVLTRLAAEGWVCVSITYGLSPWATFPDHLVDVKRGIAWAREHAHEFGGDPRFLALHGNSAGAHLSALAALTPNDPVYQPGFSEADTSVDACVPVYGPMHVGPTGSLNFDFRLVFDLLVMKRSRRRDPAAFVEASPLERVHPDAPPFFVVHGSGDSLVPVEHGRAFVAACREVMRAPVGYAEIPGGQHALDIFHSRRGVAVADGICAFLRHQHARQVAS